MTERPTTGETFLGRAAAAVDPEGKAGSSFGKREAVLAGNATTAVGAGAVGKALELSVHADAAWAGEWEGVRRC